MKVETHNIEGIRVAELISEEYIIGNAEDALDLIGNLGYQDYYHVIIYEKNIIPDFFDLKNGMTGEIFQKFSNYRIRLVIVGDFSKYTGKSINSFIYESNKGRQINFLSSVSEAIKVLSNV